MRSFIAFFSRLDERAVRAICVGAGLLALVAIGYAVGQTALNGDAQAGISDWLGAMRESGWGLPAAVIVFLIAAFLAVPQTLLFGMAVLVFGFERGVFYGWFATMISATATYAVGRALGADVLDSLGGGAGRKVAAFVGSNGFSASCLIRLVPSAPFIVVNMALGAAGVRPLAFIPGTALGVIPKALVVGAIAGGVLELSGGGDWRVALGLAALAAVWIGVIALVRRRFRTADR